MIKEINAVRSFRHLRVLVVGDAMLDVYYLGTASRLSAEGPIPVVRSRERKFLPGGAANTAANARALGARVSILAVTGADHEGELLRQVLQERRVDASPLIVDPTRPTTTKLRIISDDQFVARFDDERDEEISGEVEEAFFAAFRRLFQESDVVLISDYMKGVISSRFVTELSALNRDNRRLVVVDSKDLSRHRFRNISVITPNHLEAQKACSVDSGLHREDGPSSMEGLGRNLLEQIGTRWVIMTTGADGALLFERGQPTVRVQAREVRHPDVIGAGDTFSATLALALASDLEIAEAAHVAVEAAGIAVSRPLTVAIEQHELVQRLSRWADVSGSESLTDHLEQYRSQGKKIVFANGSFDGLHSGHVNFLRDARKLGDVLLVGINSDESLRKKTGRKPLLPEEERFTVVAALESVDHALLFDEEIPRALIREIRPHILAKGGDYLEDEIPEADAITEVGGEIVILPLSRPQFWPFPESRLPRALRPGRGTRSSARGGDESRAEQSDSPTALRKEAIEQ